MTSRARDFVPPNKTSRVPDAALAFPSVGPPVVPRVRVVRARVSSRRHARVVPVRGGAAVAALREPSLGSARVRGPRVPVASALARVLDRRRRLFRARRRPPPPTRRPPLSRGRAGSATSPRRTASFARSSWTRTASSARSRGARRAARTRRGAGSRCAPSRSSGAGVKLQVVKYDQRQAFTSNHAYPGASTRRSSATGARRGGRESASALEAADEALACGFAELAR